MTALAGVFFGPDAYFGPDGAREDCRRILSGQRAYSDREPRVAEVPEGALGIAVHSRHLAGPLARLPDRGPIALAGNTVTLVADARLDRREELCDLLGLSRNEASSWCDAQLIALGWERFGVRILGHLHGDFAIAVWDAAARRLTLARDFVGQRPLFYHRGSRAVAFASMPAGLLALPGVRSEPDRVAVANYVLLRGVPQPSFFADIEAVPPGHLVEIDRQGVRVDRHWNPPAQAPGRPTPAEVAEEAGALFHRAVAARIEGTGQLGSHLSGGLDSAGVTASAARQLAEGRRLAAFTSVPFPGSDHRAPPGRFVDEGPLAASVAARYLSIDHRLVHSTREDPTAPWDKAFALFQSPLPNPCNFLWTSGINDAARRMGVTAMLTGQLGNLSLSFDPAGHLANLLTKGTLGAWAREFAGHRRGGESMHSLLAATILPLLPPPLLRPLAKWRGSIVALDGASFATAEARSLADAPAHDSVAALRDRDNRGRRIRAIARFDYGTFNKGVLAGWGIDMRDPTADRALVEFCLSLPDSAFRHRGVRRALAREVFADLLPRDVLDEERRGFQAADWRASVLAARPSLASEAERAEGVEEAVELIDLASARAALDGMGGDDAPGQPDETRLRMGMQRALAAGHFIRKATGSNR